MVDISKLKAGDTVMVKLVVNHSEPNFKGRVICVSSVGGYENYIHLADIVESIPKPVEVTVGTKFRAVKSPFGTLYTVVLIEDDYVMYKYYDDNFRLRSSVSEIEEVRRYLTQHPLTDQEQANNG